MHFKKRKSSFHRHTHFFNQLQFLLFPLIFHRPQSSSRFSIVFHRSQSHYIFGRKAIESHSVQLSSLVHHNCHSIFHVNVIRILSHSIPDNNSLESLFPNLPFPFLFSIYKLHSSEKFTFELSSTFNWLDVLVYIFSFFFFFFMLS